MLIKIDKEKHYKSLLFIAESCYWNTGLCNNLIALYKSDGFRFYESAKRYFDIYPYNRAKSGTLEMETQIKRIIGILTAAEEDNYLKDKLLILLSQFYTDISIYVKKKDPNIRRVINNLYEKPMDAFESNGISRMIYYLTYLNFGYVFESSDSFSEVFNYFEKALDYHINYESDTISRADKSIETNIAAISKIIGQYGIIQSTFDIQNIQDVIDYKNGISISIDKNKFFNNMPSVEIIKPNLDVYKISASIIDYEKMSYDCILRDIKLSKQELKRIAGLVYDIKVTNKNNASREYDEYAYLFFTSIMIQSLIKAYKRAKDFYNINNQENYFAEIHNLDSKVSKLTKDNENLKYKIECFEKEKSDWDVKLKKNISNIEKGNYQQIKDYEDEISALKEQIIVLNKKNQEIDKLRNLAFSIDVESNEIEKDLDITDLINEKKIFVLGGSEKWHKQIKESLPGISTVNGSNVNINPIVFSSADFILFFTGHMAHQCYYKAIDYIQRNNIQFDYLKNQNIRFLKKKIYEHYKN